MTRDEHLALAFLGVSGAMHCKTADQVRHWIDGFN